MPIVVMFFLNKEEKFKNRVTDAPNDGGIDLCIEEIDFPHTYIIFQVKYLNLLSKYINLAEHSIVFCQTSPPSLLE